MTIHWEALEEHFLIVPLVLRFRFLNFSRKPPCKHYDRTFQQAKAYLLCDITLGIVFSLIRQTLFVFTRFRRELALLHVKPYFTPPDSKNRTHNQSTTPSN
jgi:hypothetical protein